MNNNLCPHCGVDVSVGGVRFDGAYRVAGKVLFKGDDLDFEVVKVYPGMKDTRFTCSTCGRTLLYDKKSKASEGKVHKYLVANISKN